ncbi:hypothetical protein AOQ84DRAFT_378072 [Glonium stellatum]|uniref:DSBA-like thioredoxin domain-containing protein n=1 Tax=Glonium stellatum TaxID=574774 RepID=A0A8E2EYS3_9PEZI|nr:hypothetical protein AOQ84DRAFT_378072 [Glonium stellatum]
MLSRMGPERTAKTGNSRLSHQLLELAKRKSLETQWNIAQELFKLQFEEERDITDIQTLVDAGVRCGFSKDEVSEWLNGQKGVEAVNREVEKVKKMGIDGVPRFLLQDGNYSIEGAADTMDFFEIFIKIKEQEGV